MEYSLAFKIHRGSLTPLYDLLLLADPSTDMIEQYIHQSEVVTAHLADRLIGLYALFPLNNDSAEIKNLVVIPEFQGKGFGEEILHHAIAHAHQKGFQKLIIGTGNSSIAQLYLYQKMGFTITETKTNFFRNHYPEPIFENGVECCDMIVLAKNLDQELS